MGNGGERSGNVRHRDGTRGWVASLLRPLDHDDGQAQPPRSIDLAIARTAARVFRNQSVDSVLGEHADFILQREGTACGHVPRLREDQRRIHGVDAADEIMVLGCGFERKKLLPSQSQKHAFAFASDRRHSLFDAGHLMPYVTRLALPGRPGKDDKRHFGEPRRLNGIGGNSRRIGMSCVHENVETPAANEIRKTAGATEATTAHRHRLFDRRKCSASHGEQNAVTGFLRQPACQYPGIRRAAKDEYGACHDV